MANISSQFYITEMVEIILFFFSQQLFVEHLLYRRLVWERSREAPSGFPARILSGVAEAARLRTELLTPSWAASVQGKAGEEGAHTAMVKKGF